MVVKRIEDLDELRSQAYTIPIRLLYSLENKTGRGEAWWVLRASSERHPDARWLTVFPDQNEAVLYLEDGALEGRWDPNLNVFFPEDEPPVNLLGEPVNVSDLEDQADEEEFYRWERAQARDDAFASGSGDALRNLYTGI